MARGSFDRRVSGFFDGAPRPPAPPSLRHASVGLEAVAGIGRRRSNARLVTGLAATVILVAGVAGFAVFAGGLRGTPAASASSPSPSHTAASTGSSLLWDATKIEPSALAFLDGTTSLIQFRQQRGGPVEIVASSDPVRWTDTADTLPTRGAAREATVYDAAAWTSFIAVGSDGASGAAWVSDTGTQWRETSLAPANSAVTHVAIGNEGWIATSESRNEPVETTVWISRDGNSWAEADRVSGRGASLAVAGSSIVLSWPETSRLRTSADGKTWHDAILPLNGWVVATSGGFTSVAPDGSWSFSRDGATWNQPRAASLPLPVAGVWGWNGIAIAALAVDATNCTNDPRVFSLTQEGTWSAVSEPEFGPNAPNYCYSTRRLYPLASGFIAQVQPLPLDKGFAPNFYWVHARIGPEPTTSPAPSPRPSVAISEAQAKAAVRAFVGRDVDLTVAQFGNTANGPAYQLTESGADGITAAVDATTGRVTMLMVSGSVPGGIVKLSMQQAQAKAEEFLRAHGVPFDGMRLTSDLRDQGDSKQFEFSWVRYQGDVKLPDSRTVDVNPETGAVFNFLDFRHDVGTVPAAAVTKDQAIAKAEAAVPDMQKPTVQSVELAYAPIPPNAEFKLVWSVQLSATAPEGYVLAAWVWVDAVTGEATVGGRG